MDEEIRLFIQGWIIEYKNTLFPQYPQSNLKGKHKSISNSNNLFCYLSLEKAQMTKHHKEIH